MFPEKKLFVSTYKKRKFANTIYRPYLYIYIYCAFDNWMNHYRFTRSVLLARFWSAKNPENCSVLTKKIKIKQYCSCVSFNKNLRVQYVDENTILAMVAVRVTGKKNHLDANKRKLFKQWSLKRDLFSRTDELRRNEPETIFATVLR